MGGMSSGPVMTDETGWTRDREAELALVERGRLERDEARRYQAQRTVEAIERARLLAAPKKPGSKL